MKSKQPRFSVVIPAYNEQNYIVGTLASLKRQTFENDQVEIIVVDNNSTDSTAKLAADAGAIVLKEPNVGICWARQRGTQAAKGEIIVSTDADTIYDNDWLKNIDQLFKTKSDIVAVAGVCKFENAPFWAKIYPKLLFGLVAFGYKVTGKTYYASATNIAFKKSAWVGYDTKLNQGGDELDLLRNLRHK